MTAVKVRNCQAQGELVEDVFLSRKPPVAASLAGRFAAVQVHGERRENWLLTVSDGATELVTFLPDPASATGWEMQVASVPEEGTDPIERLIAFWHQDTLHALVLYAKAGEHGGGGPAALRCRLLHRTADGRWRRSPFDSRIRSILEQTLDMACYEDPEGRLFVYGISIGHEKGPRPFVLSYGETGWTSLNLERSGLTEERFDIVAGRGPGQVTLVKRGEGTMLLRGATITSEGVLADAGDDVKVSLANPLAQVCTFISPSLSESFLVRDAQGAAYLVADYLGAAPNTHRLTGLPDQPERVTEVRSGMDASGRTLVFAIDHTGALWILRQQVGANGVAGSSLRDASLVFAEWSELGDASASVACPAHMGEAGEAFIADLDRSVRRLAQDAGQQLWTDTTIRTPAAAEGLAEAGYSYNVEFLARDAEGVPLPRTRVEISSDRVASIMIAGIGYGIGSTEPIAVDTDETGRVAVAVRATELVAPLLRFHVPAAMKPGESLPVRADAQAHRRLAGQVKDFEVSARALRQQGICTEHTKDADLEVLAGYLKEVGGAVVKLGQVESGDAAPDTVTPTPWTSLRLGPSGGLQSATYTPEEFAAVRGEWLKTDTRLMASPGANLFGIGWGDFVHWVGKKAKAVTHMVFRFVGRVLQVAFRVATGMYEFALDTVTAAGKAFEVILSGLEAAWGVVKSAVGSFVRKVIRWVAWLFGWKDISDTAYMLEAYIWKGMLEAHAYLGAVEDRIREAIESAIQRVDESFRRLEDRIGKASLDAWTSKPGTGLAAGVLDDRTVRDSYDAHAVQCNYLTNRIPPDAPALMAWSHPEVALDGTGVDFLDRLAEVLSMEELQASLKDFHKLCRGLKNPEALIKTALVALLEALRGTIGLTLKAVLAVTTALMDAMQGAIEALVGWLKAPIHVPGLSDLLRRLGLEGEMSAMRLVTLLIALPVTLITKLIKGKAPVPAELAGEVKVPPLDSMSLDEMKQWADQRIRRYHSAPHATAMLPALRLVSGLSWEGKYLCLAAAARGSPRPPPAWMTLPGSAAGFAAATMEAYPFGLGPKGDVGAGDDAWASLSTLLAGLGIGLGFVLEKTYGSGPGRTASLLVISGMQGLFQTASAICLAVSGTRPPFFEAKTFLTAFPDVFMAGAGIEPVSMNLLGSLSWVGAIATSGFVEVEVAFR